MARNKVQFQKGLSEAQFAVLYGTEDQCREAVMRWRWPSGFVCPVCAGEHHSFVKTRALYQCSACRRQTSVIAGTIFAATKVPLCTWFRAMYHLTQSKGGISSIELGRRLGVTQTTAWKIKHKLMQAMMERDATKRRHHDPICCAPTVTQGLMCRSGRWASAAQEPKVRLTCMGLFLSSSRFGLFPVLCWERKGRSSSRRLRSGSRSARKGSRDRNASQGLAACRLAALVFRSALTPEHAER